MGGRRSAAAVLACVAVGCVRPPAPPATGSSAAGETAPTTPACPAAELPPAPPPPGGGPAGERAPPPPPPPAAGPPPPRVWRLTHAQLRNTLLDVFGYVGPAVDALPPDSRLDGFANGADRLGVPPLLLE